MSRFAWYALTFPADLSPDAVTQFMRSLAARGRKGWIGGGRSILFETEHTGRDWQWRLGVRTDEAAAVLRLLRSHLPQVAYEAVDNPRSLVSRGVELRLRSALRSVRVDQSEAAASTVLNTMSGIGKDETVLLQWVVGPWLPRSPVPNPSDRPQPGMPWELFQPGVALDAEATQALRRKQSEPIFGAVGRVAVEAAGRSRQEQLLRRVFNGLQVLREPGAGFMRRLVPGGMVSGRALDGRAPILEWPCALNAAELTAVLGWPLGGPMLPGVTYRSSRLLPAPDRVLLSAKVRNAVGSTGLDHKLRAVASATYPNQRGSLVLRPNDALRHLHVLGPTGSGKSHLLTNLISQDIAAGRGVVVIEPKSDLIANVLERIPEHRLSDVVVIDGSGASSPVGVNPLHGVTHANRELVVDQVLGLLHSLWRESWGPRTNDVLHAGLLTLAGSKHASLVGLPALFTNDAFRRTAVAEALAVDPWGLSAFWAWFDGLSVQQRAQVLGPVMSKLRAFLLRPTMRAILGQTEPRFHMRQVFTERKIVLVNLAKGSIGPEASALLGSILMAQLWQAIQSRSHIAAEHRHPVMVYVDEFQDYLHATTDFADVLAQARGLGVGVTISHQHLAQLTPSVKEAVLANAQSRVCFRLGHRDAKTMAEGHPELTGDDLAGLGRFEVYASLLADGAAQPYASGRTTELAPRTSTPADVRRRSEARFGVAASDTDAALKGLLDTPTDFDLGVDFDGEFGVRRTGS